ncbi:MAG: hypothetical protein H6721_07885 [Sandaracinus sp.]|nr:hypothetical protein [Myxococcales bacterium]MCB9598814.1 hypothetical protein [Sandaracinus sp.]MCB9632038.1 hypothetical protein [Sandaracinus sp.]
MKRVLWLSLVLAACGDDDVLPTDGGIDDASPDALVEDAGPACAVGRWSPTSDDLHQWPDPSLLVEDESRATGYRLAFDETRFAPLLRRMAGYSPIFTEDLPTLDGFGSTSGIFFRFERAFDPEGIPDGVETATPTRGSAWPSSTTYRGSCRSRHAPPTRARRS